MADEENINYEELLAKYGIDVNELKARGISPKAFYDSLIFAAQHKEVLNATIKEQLKPKYEQLREISKTLDSLDTQIKKIDNDIQTLATKKLNLSKEFSDDMIKFNKIIEDIKKVGIENKEIVENVPESSKFINIGKGTINRISKRMEKEISKIPLQKVIDPLTGKVYKSFREYADEHNIFVGTDSANRAIQRTLGISLLPFSQENKELVDNCVKTPPCEVELQNSILKAKQIGIKKITEKGPQTLKYLPPEETLNILRKWKQAMEH